MFDKNNWYVNCNKLTDGQYKEVCTFLRMYNSYEETSCFGAHISMISLGEVCKSQLVNKPWYAGVVNGVCNVKFCKDKDRGDTFFKGIPEITYHEFLEHVLNKNNANCSNVSDGDSRNMQIDIKEVLNTL